MHRLLLTLILAPALLLAACGDDSGSAGPGPDVVATTTQAADLARNVAGDRASVHGMIPANADPHDYEPRPDDVKALGRADLVVRSGGDLDEWLGDAIGGAGGDPATLTLIDHVRTRHGGHAHEHEEEGHGDEEVDPHWWQDPRNAERAVAAIRDALTEADPDGRASYAANAGAYLRRLRALDRGVAACIDRIPAARRHLVTTHDALGYYAERYGIEVIGTVIPALTTQGQPSSKDTQRLVADIEHAGVQTVFAESSVNQRVERAIADQAGARVGGQLWADALGPEGSPGATYLGSIAANTKTIVAGIGGGASCRLSAR